MDVLASLRFAQSDYNFLYAAVSFWDVANYCFCFGNHDLTILLDEFGSIIGWLVDNYHMSLVWRIIFFKDFERFMELKEENIFEILYGRRVILTRLAARNSSPTKRARQTYRMRALVFCLLAVFCL